MKNRTLRLAIAIVLPLLTGVPNALSQDNVSTATNPSQDETIKLPSFTVSSEKGDPYRPVETVSLARVAGQLIDTPLSISVVPKELLEDLGANSMLDATRYMSGITNGRAAGAGGILDREDFRGFESFTRTVDGLSMFLIPGNNGPQANFDPAFIERVEVVKGPDSILSPTGSPGGSINVITKSPLFTPANDLSVEIGNYNAGKAIIDSSGPIGSGKHWAYRVIADYQDGKTYVPGSIRQQNLSTQLTYKFSDTTKITFKYFGQQWALFGAIANPNDNGWYVVDPSTLGTTIGDKPVAGTGFTYNGWDGDTTWSHRYDRVNIGTTEFTTAIAERVIMRLAAAVVYDNFNQDAGYITQAVPAITYNAAGQPVAIGAWNPTSVKETATHVKSQNNDEQIQNDYAANFHPGLVSLQPVVGWTYQQGSNPPNYNKTAPLPNINLTNYTIATALPGQPAVGSYYAPVHPDNSAYTALGVSGKANAWQYQAYGLTKAGFYDDRVLLTGGVSRLWTSNTSINFLKDPTVPNSGYSVTLNGKKDTYLGGVLFKPAKNVSLYYTYSSNAAITSFNSTPLWQTGKQHEFGIKTEFFNQRLSLTAAHFQITQTNLSSPNPLFNIDPTHQPSNILADETNHGFEFDAVGGVTKNLSAIASFTTMKLRDAFGRRIRNVPDNTANLLLNYHFGEGALKNFNVFAGVQHQGETAGDSVTTFTGTVPDEPSFYVKAWTAVNAGAGYTWRRYRFNLNVDNVLNSKFVWQPAGRNSVSPYPGITFRLTTVVSF
jgi:iron complex outermembrane receptor protein